MPARREWFTAQELAGLPGMPATYSAVIRWSKKNLAQTRSKLRGKGLEYSREGLPEETQRHLAQRDMAEVLATLPETPAAPVTAALQVIPGGRAVTPAVARETHDSTEAERQRRLARVVVVRMLTDLVAAGAGSINAASAILLDRARAGALPPAMLGKLQQACDERGKRAGELPTARTLRAWASAAKDGRDLTPRPSAVVDLRVRAWYVPFFALTDRPQKPTLRWAHEQLLSAWRPEWADPPGSEPPSYDQAVRAYNKRSKGDALKGRHTGSALRALSFYQHRTYQGLAPFSEVHSDGWTTHFTAPHPVTGEFVTYEVWHSHCVATRFLPPMAIGLTENPDVVKECLRNIILAGGVPAIWQTDHTGSVKNDEMTEAGSGLADRLGMTVVHPAEVGNSQANGMAENFNTWLDRQARELATYQNPARMDSGTFVRMRRLTNAMVKAASNPAERERLRQQAIRLGKGLVFDSYAEAVAWIRALEDRWNDHPHRELPKMRDPQSGRMVHMTPRQSLNAAIAGGWKPVALTEAELVDEFRPHIKRKVTRGTVTPYNGMRYRSAELDAYEGEAVLVAVDPDQLDRVWVKDLKGRLLTVAAFVEATSSRTESMREHTERKRAERQIRRREQQIERIEERIAPAALEMPDAGGVIEWPVDIAPVPVGKYDHLQHDEVSDKRKQKEREDLSRRAVEAPEDIDPLELYVRMKLREQEALKAQAALEEERADQEFWRQVAERAAQGDQGDEEPERAAE